LVEFQKLRELFELIRLRQRISYGCKVWFTFKNNCTDFCQVQGVLCLITHCHGWNWI